MVNTMKILASMVLVVCTCASLADNRQEIDLGMSEFEAWYLAQTIMYLQDFGGLSYCDMTNGKLFTVAYKSDVEKFTDEQIRKHFACFYLVRHPEPAISLTEPLAGFERWYATIQDIEPFYFGNDDGSDPSFE